MKREELKALGLTDEQIDKVMAENGKDIEKHKTEAETSKTAAAQLKTQLDEATKSIEGFKGMDIEGIKTAADDYKAKLEESEKTHAAELAKIAYNSAAEKFIDGLKPKDGLSKKAILAEFASKEFKIDGENFIGGKEWADTFKKDNASHFSDGTPPPAVFAGRTDGNPLPPAVATDLRSAMREKFSQQ